MGVEQKNLVATKARPDKRGMTTMNIWKMSCIAGLLIIGTGMGILACGGGSCGEPTDGNGSTSGALTASENCQDAGLSAAEAAAVSLTNALKANNPNAETITGQFPGDITGATDQGSITAGPGETISISTRASSPEDPDDPVVASLVWMEGSNSFISLPSSGADSNENDTLQNSFTVDQSVCDNLCNIVHQVKCYEAAQTASGTITAANLTTVVLECTGAGNPAECPSVSNIVANGAGGGGNFGTCQQICTFAAGCPEANAPDIGTCVFGCTNDPFRDAILNCWEQANPQSCTDYAALKSAEECIDDVDDDDDD